LKFLIQAEIISFVNDNGVAIYFFQKNNAPSWYLNALFDAWKKD